LVCLLLGRLWGSFLVPFTFLILHEVVPVAGKPDFLYICICCPAGDPQQPTFHFSARVSSSKRPQSKILKNFLGSLRMGKREWGAVVAGCRWWTETIYKALQKLQLAAAPMPICHLSAQPPLMAKASTGWQVLSQEIQNHTKDSKDAKDPRNMYFGYGFGFSWVSPLISRFSSSPTPLPSI